MHGINTPESFNMQKIISVGQEENNLQNQNVAVVWFQVCPPGFENLTASLNLVKTKARINLQ